MRKILVRPLLGLAIVAVVVVAALPLVTLASNAGSSRPAAPAVQSTGPAGPPAAVRAYDVEPVGFAPTVTEWQFWAIFALVLLGGYVLQSGDRDGP
jgi:hypothetical protein